MNDHFIGRKLITPKTQFTQTFFANQAEMIVSSWKVTQMTQLLANQAKLNSNTAGLELFQSDCSGDAYKAATLLSASSVQSYINYTDVKGRTSLYKSASQGDTLIVTQLIAAHSNVDLTKTTDGTTPLFIVAQNGHASVARLLIEARCNVDHVLKTNGAKPLHVAAVEGHADAIKQLISA